MRSLSQGSVFNDGFAYSLDGTSASATAHGNLDLPSVLRKRTLAINTTLYQNVRDQTEMRST